MDSLHRGRLEQISEVGAAQKDESAILFFLRYIPTFAPNHPISNQIINK